MQFLSGLSGSQFGQLGLEFGLGFGELGDLALNSFNSCATNDHYYRRMWYALQFDSVMADTATNNNNNITVMDTSNSPPPDSMDSRKRNAESSPDNLKTKRTNYGGDGVCQIKILVPSYAAGAIIGKGGETIAQIQKDTGSKIKMSKANDFYPGTSDRVCLISGQPDDIKHILKFIMEKIRARPDMTEDPSSGSCSNVSYADVNGPVASVNPTGSPFATTPFLQQQQQQGNMSNYGSSLAPHQVGAPLSVNNGVSTNNSSGGLNFSLNFNSQPPVSNTTLAATSQLIEHMKVLIQALGYSDLASNEISAAMATLAKYGILGLGLGTQQALNNFTSPPSWQDPLAQSSGSRALDFPASSSFGGRPGSPGGRNYGGGASDVESKKVEIEVPEIIVGAILGPGGRSLNDIMGRSGANVQISKKGSFAPGTRNRVVTISGSPNAIAHAQILIDSKIKDEEWKRNSLNMNTD
ncbi:hypothetical protein M8J76_001951 [Diaphorina citri]|nr:hypothetical protein M8J76_001951 [Diaphorina citri]